MEKLDRKKMLKYTSMICLLLTEPEFVSQEKVAKFGPYAERSMNNESFD